MTVRLTRAGVLLRPFDDDELQRLVEVYAAAPAGDGIHWGPRDRDALRARIEASGTWSNGPAGLMLAIETGGRLVGEIQARGGTSQLLPPGVFELGIDLYEATERGRGIGAAAVAELTGHLFGEEGANRVQISTDIGNVAMRRVCERLGFGFEGVLRGFMPTNDGPRDYAMYGMTHDDYREVSTTWTSTG